MTVWFAVRTIMVGLFVLVFTAAAQEATGFVSTAGEKQSQIEQALQQNLDEITQLRERRKKVRARLFMAKLRQKRAESQAALLKNELKKLHEQIEMRREKVADLQKKLTALKEQDESHAFETDAVIEQKLRNFLKETFGEQQVDLDILRQRMMEPLISLEKVIATPDIKLSPRMQVLCSKFLKSAKKQVESLFAGIKSQIVPPTHGWLEKVLDGLTTPAENRAWFVAEWRKNIRALTKKYAQVTRQVMAETAQEEATNVVESLSEILKRVEAKTQGVKAIFLGE